MPKWWDIRWVKLLGRTDVDGLEVAYCILAQVVKAEIQLKLAVEYTGWFSLDGKAAARRFIR